MMKAYTRNGSLTLSGYLSRKPTLGRFDGFGRLRAERILIEAIGNRVTNSVWFAIRDRTAEPIMARIKIIIIRRTCSREGMIFRKAVKI
jgi:hypothetical protein